MKPQEPASLNLKHTLGVSISLVLGGILIWVIQLARSGEPIGYVILTGLGVILVLPVVGLVLYLLIGAIGKLQRGQSTDDVKTILRDATGVTGPKSGIGSIALANAEQPKPS